MEAATRSPASTPVPAGVQPVPHPAFEESLRWLMRLWRRQGRVLEADSPLWKYWPSDDAADDEAA